MVLSSSKKWSALLIGISQKHLADFYCFYCFHWFRTKNKLELHKQVYENKDLRCVVMSSEYCKILEFI